MRASGSSFHQAFRLLPLERRRSLEALYAYCRVVDDAADDGKAAAGRPAIDEWRRELDRVLADAPTHPVGVALADSIHRFAIPTQHLREILDGVAMDLTPQRFATFTELRRYCYLVAAAVGLATIPIFGCRDPRSRDYAEALGIALQLTNITARPRRGRRARPHLSPAGGPAALRLLGARARDPHAGTTRSGH